MAQGESATRRLIVNADDFGRSRSINQAIIQAHREGILTSASLMVTGEAFDEAVELARQFPSLGVGLHLTFVCGRSALTNEEIPGLVDREGRFSSNAVAAGIRYFFGGALRTQLEAELDAQFAKFNATGLVLDHVNGHLNFHLHPTIFSVLKSRLGRGAIKRVRLTYDPFFLNARIAQGAWWYRISHAFIFSILAKQSKPALDRHGIQHTHYVFGLLQNARVDLSYVSSLIPCLPAGDSELYSHPSLCEFRSEFEALVNPAVRELIQRHGIQLIRYQDL